jgi:serine/threonine-protein kinase
MKEDRWARVWALFHAALERDPVVRASWLAGECGSDRELAAEVGSLLAAHARSDNVLDRPPAARAFASTLADGASVGHWRVLRTLGRGGMGQVYLVERSDGEYTQQAALKLIDPLLVRPELIERFLRERQILARLSHPSIARLIDGGHADDGRPFLVMEYVVGEPIDRWAATCGDDWERRVAVLRRVCEAVDFAHRQLIVHRDLKPSNVLVGAGDAPHLLDFGIAKSLDDAGADAVTRLGELRPLTPRYASPEQLEGAGGGTTGDVYALGVLLYETLSGAAPYEVEGLTWRELARRLREKEIAPLRHAARRGDARARLPVELDWIAARAMHPDPEQRYRSAADLGDDLAALLDHRPVAARPESQFYVARKFVRRNWPWVAVAGAFVALAIGFVLRLDAEAERTRTALAASERERDRAERVADFLAELFRIADTTQAGGRVVSAREILDRGREQLAARSDLPAASRIVLLNSLGAVYSNMGAYADAAAMFEEARTRLPEVASSALEAETHGNLGVVLTRAGRQKEARAPLEQALALARAAQPLDVQAVALAAERLGTVLRDLGEREQALLLLEESWAARQALAPADPRRAETALRLGSWYLVAGRMEQADALYRAALEVRRAELPANLPELARTIEANAILANARNHTDEAIDLFRESLALRREALGNQHPLVAGTLANLGATEYERGDDAAAEPPLREAIAIYDEGLGPDSTAMARALNNLGNVRVRLGDYDEAQALFERALAINREAYGDESTQVVEPLNNLGLVALGRENFAAAEQLFGEALAVYEKALGREHPRLGYILTNLARAAWLSGKDAAAVPLLARALELRERELGPDAALVGDTRYWFGWVDCSAGRNAQGIAHLRHTLALRERSEGATTARAQSARLALGVCLIESEATRNEGAALLEGLSEPDPKTTPARIRAAWVRARMLLER